MKQKEYVFSDLLDFVIFTFIPAIIVVMQCLDYYYFLFDWGLDMTKANPLIVALLAKAWLIIALLASYRLKYCKYHKRMIYLILIVQAIGYFEAYFPNCIAEVNVLMLIMLYESLKALLQVVRIFILQSRTLRKIKTLYNVAKRNNKRRTA